MATRYLRNAATSVATPPQSQPLDERQVANSARGYSYPVSIWSQLDRFLILGSEGGSYYASEKELTVKNIKAVEQCIKENGLRTVERIVEISDAGRAPKNDPALLALACAAGKGDAATKSAALDALPKVARIGTHLFHFVDFVQQFRGWGRGLRSGVAQWYLQQDAERLADQVTKYQQRDGWSHRDLLRLTHVKFNNDEMNAIAHWVVKGEQIDGLPERVKAHVSLQKATDAKEAVKLIREHGLVRESVPTELLNDASVWEALLDRMPMTAMIRNLGNLSKCGLLKPLSNAAKLVTERLGDIAALKKARIHPITVLMAQKTYASGHGLRGSGQWAVAPQIVDALDDAFYNAFQNVESTGKRFYLALDISGSMFGGVVAGVPDFTPAVAAGTMAMVTVRSEKQYYTAGFTTGLEKIVLSPKQRLDDVQKVMAEMSRRMGGTDCALPMLDAIQEKLEVDVFIVYTDSETWAGRVHPVKALRQYRQKSGIPAKLIVCGLVANKLSIADPEDGGMLDIVGFDSVAPQVIAEFAGNG